MDVIKVDDRQTESATITDAPMPRDYPGFDGVRIVAALSVVFSHSFLLAETNEKNEPFQYLTGEILGVYGVYIFFILSGFLVTDSALRSRSVMSFAMKRARRILPAFLVANLFMVLMICPWFATKGPVAFLSDAQTWRVLFNVLTLQETRLWYESVSFYQGSNAAGVWLAHSVNGVLWTIRLEILCYLVVGILMLLRLLRPNVAIVLVALGAVYAFQYHLQPEGWGGMGLLFPSFAAGIAMRLHIGAHVPSMRLGMLSAFALLIAMFVLPDWDKLAAVFFPLFASYPLLSFGVYGGRKGRLAGHGTDPSYGIYIWGWPVQQLLLAMLLQAGVSDLSGYAFAFLSMPAAYLAGIVSWHIIERPFLNRHRLVNGLGSSFTQAK